MCVYVCVPPRVLACEYGSACVWLCACGCECAHARASVHMGVRAWMSAPYVHACVVALRALVRVGGTWVWVCLFSCACAQMRAFAYTRQCVHVNGIHARIIPTDYVMAGVLLGTPGRIGPLLKPCTCTMEECMISPWNTACVGRCVASVCFLLSFPM
jgi:hypothetical protein